MEGAPGGGGWRAQKKESLDRVLFYSAIGDVEPALAHLNLALRRYGVDEALGLLNQYFHGGADENMWIDATDMPVWADLETEARVLMQNIDGLIANIRAGVLTQEWLDHFRQSWLEEVTITWLPDLRQLAANADVARNGTLNQIDIQHAAPLRDVTSVYTNFDTVRGFEREHAEMQQHPFAPAPVATAAAPQVPEETKKRLRDMR